MLQRRWLRCGSDWCVGAAAVHFWRGEREGAEVAAQFSRGSQREDGGLVVLFSFRRPSLFLQLGVGDCSDEVFRRVALADGGGMTCARSGFNADAVLW